MTLFLHEIKRSRLSLIIWTAALSFMLLICVVIYPEMKAQMSELGDMFADMGTFSDAFGMEMLTSGDFLGYFALECGEVLGMGGAVFAAIVGIGALSKEQRDRTAELLLTQPITRAFIVTQKLFAALSQIFVLNLIVDLITVIGILVIGESADAQKLFWVLFSYFIMQIEVCLICFGISAFLNRGGIGIGIGISMCFYFLNIIANISDEVEFLKYLSPFAYTDANYILEHGILDWKFVIIGSAFAIFGTLAAYAKYTKKDIL